MNADKMGEKTGGADLLEECLQLFKPIHIFHFQLDEESLLCPSEN